MNPVAAGTQNKSQWRLALESCLREEPDEGEFADLSDRAGTWEHCAIGENRAKLIEQRYVFAESLPYGPMSSTLLRLGLQFQVHIEDREWEEALKILDEIEAIANPPGRQSNES